MKNFISSLLVGIFVCSFAVLMAQEHDAPPAIEIAYMKAKTADYVSVETDMWKKIHQSRIEANQMRAWYLYEVMFPYGTQTEYNYVAVNVYASALDLGGLMGSSFMDHLNNAELDMSAEKLFAKTEASRDMVRSEVFIPMTGVTEERPDAPAEFIMVNFMQVDPSQTDAYLDWEMNISKPMQAARVEAGMMEDWLLARRMFPSGAAYNYDFMTVDAYGSWENIFKWPSEEMMQEALGADFNMDKAFDELLTYRTLLRGEVWHLVDFVWAED